MISGGKLNIILILKTIMSINHSKPDSLKYICLIILNIDDYEEINEPTSG